MSGLIVLVLCFALIQYVETQKSCVRLVFASISHEMLSPPLPLSNPPSVSPTRHTQPPQTQPHGHQGVHAATVAAARFPEETQDTDKEAHLDLPTTTPPPPPAPPPHLHKRFDIDHVALSTQQQG